jgi:hypothetical protein
MCILVTLVATITTNWLGFSYLLLCRTHDSTFASSFHVCCISFGSWQVIITQHMAPPCSKFVFSARAFSPWTVIDPVIIDPAISTWVTVYALEILFNFKWSTRRFVLSSIIHILYQSSSLHNRNQWKLPLNGQHIWLDWKIICSSHIWN